MLFRDDTSRSGIAQDLSGRGAGIEDTTALKLRIHQRLLDLLNLSLLDKTPRETLRIEIRDAVVQLLAQERRLLTVAQTDQLIEDVLDEILGLGPLEPLLKDDTVNDILITTHSRAFVDRRGLIEATEVHFQDTAHLIRIINKIVAAVGRRIDESQPMVDARLADGSRVNAIIPPLAVDGPLVSIRKFSSKALSIDKLVGYGSLTEEMALVLRAIVQARRNVLISGGTGSGKTTLLNAMSAYIDIAERVITIEDSAELQLQQPHVGRLETRPMNIEGKGEISQRDLVRNCLRMRPDRIIIGECRGGEAMDMLQAMNTGHDGSMTTVHANNAREALGRLEVMIAMAGYDIPMRALRTQISAAVQIIVQVRRITGGKRKITSVTEIVGMEGESVQMHDLFLFEQTGVDKDGHATGRFTCAGIRPHAAERIESRGIQLPSDLFARRVIEV